MNNFIPLSIPTISGDEEKYVLEAIRDAWVSSSGPHVEKFEKEITSYTGAKYAVACVNGTAALHLSLITAGVKEDDMVIVPTLTFIAPINVVSYIGAEPIFMDCDEYYNIDPVKVREFLEKFTYKQNNATYYKENNKRISAIIPVHVFGNAVNIEPLVEICEEFNLIMIEDSTESLGSYYSEGNFEGKHTGTVGLVGCYSFNGNKIITSGGGGVIVTDKEEIANKARYLSTQAKDDPVMYEHNEIGFNYRLTNIQAAFALGQLENLENYIEIKRKNYSYYKEKIDNIDGLFFAELPAYARNNYWMYALQIDFNKYEKDRDELLNYLYKNNIQTRPAWSLCHLQKPFANFTRYKIENAINLWNRTLNIPCSVNLNKKEIDRIIGVL